MQDQPIQATPDSDSPASRAAEDLYDQAVVLLHVLSLQPAQVREVEIARELVGEAPTFGERDGIERAVRDLTGVGLLFRCETCVLPTRAAIRFNEILDYSV